MRFPLITRKRHEQEVAAMRGQIVELRKQVKALSDECNNRFLTFCDRAAKPARRRRRSKIQEKL